jgi:pimeloyl-ACP methyl ester carboxylesterase
MLPRPEYEFQILNSEFRIAAYDVVVPFIDIPSSPLVPGAKPVSVHYRDAGRGSPIVVLHGGWGYEAYPFDRQMAALSATHRVVIPDRSGYGLSPAIDDLPPDFHHRAAEETESVIAALGLVRPILWGHSDGAVIALLIGLASRRAAGVIVEATHLYKRKPASRSFFEAIVADPGSIGTRAAEALARDHGARWRRIVDLHSRAWLRIADAAASPIEDFYQGRLPELDVPALLMHGARDPRTEPGELDALRSALLANGSRRPAPTVHRAFRIFADGGHSPHSERASADAVTGAALEFVHAIDRIESDARADPARAADPALPAPPGRRR